jgi:hypothetical protein
MLDIHVDSLIRRLLQLARLFIASMVGSRDGDCRKSERASSDHPLPMSNGRIVK